MYSCVFIRIILDSYIDYIFSSLYLHIKSLLVVKSLILLNFFIIFLVLLIADYYDLKFGIIPNKLSLILLVYGLVFNLMLAISLKNCLILPFSLALTTIILLISFILWYIGFWGGGDLKIFVSSSLTLSFLDLNYLNVPLQNLNLPILNQYVFYPKVLSIVFNAILIAFMIIFIAILYEIIKNKQINHYLFLTLLNFNLAFDRFTTKSVAIDKLSEGMVIKKYYFKDQKVFNRINEEKNHDGSNINLNLFKDDDIFYFSSLNQIGLTEEDIILINEFYNMGLIENPMFKIKIGIPFMPFLTLGYLSLLVFGDFILIISSFIKTLF